jgi:hypothetical protein
MTHPDSSKLAWLLGAALATTTTMVASSASAQPDQAQVPEVGGGTPTPTPPNVSGPPFATRWTTAWAIGTLGPTCPRPNGERPADAL